MPTETVYVALLHEGTKVWRPVDAELLGGDRYRLLPPADYDPVDETWSVLPGSVVQCEPRSLSGQTVLVVVEAIQSADSTPGDRRQDVGPTVLTEAQLQSLEQLESRATPGPWVPWDEERDRFSGTSFIQTPGRDGPDLYVEIRVDRQFHPAATADQDFIAEARNAIPGLIAEIRRLRDSQRDD